MHSMIGNRFGTVPHQSSIHMYSSYNVSITTKPYHLYNFSAKSHLSFSHSSFSLPRSSRRGLLDQHNLGNITFRVGHPSTSLTDQKSSHLQAFFTADHFKEVLFPTQFKFYRYSHFLFFKIRLCIGCNQVVLS